MGDVAVCSEDIAYRRIRGALWPNDHDISWHENRWSVKLNAFTSKVVARAGVTYLDPAQEKADQRVSIYIARLLHPITCCGIAAALRGCRQYGLIALPVAKIQSITVNCNLPKTDSKSPEPAQNQRYTIQVILVPDEDDPVKRRQHAHAEITPDPLWRNSEAMRLLRTHLAAIANQYIRDHGEQFLRPPMHMPPQA